LEEPRKAVAAQAEQPPDNRSVAFEFVQAVAVAVAVAVAECELLIAPDGTDAAAVNMDTAEIENQAGHYEPAVG
jgi:hypothetical protein